MEKEFTVEIKEVLFKLVDVKANNADEAMEIVTKMYEDGEIVPGGDDYYVYDMQVVTKEY